MEAPTEPWDTMLKLEKAAFLHKFKGLILS